MSRSVEARSSCSAASGSVPQFASASRSRNSLSFASSAWVSMPSAMEWATPCFQPSSRALSTVVPSPGGAASDFGQGQSEGLLVEPVGLGGLSGDGDHLGPAGLEGILAVPVGGGDDAGLLAAEGAGAGGGAW